MALKSGGVAVKNGSCVAGGGGLIICTTPNPPPRAAERSEQSAALIPFNYFTMESENMSTMNLTKDEVAFLDALRDPEKCAEIVSVLQSYGLFPLPQQERNGKQ